LAAAHGLQGGKHPFPVNAIVAENLLHAALSGVQQGQQQMLHGDKIIVHFPGNLFRPGQGTVYGTGYIIAVSLPSGAGDLRQLPQFLLHRGTQAFQGDAHVLQKLGCETALLLQQGGKQMDLLDLLMAEAYGQLLCGPDGLQGFLCEFLCVHYIHPFQVNGGF